MNFNEVCGLLKENGFRRISVDGTSKWIYSNTDNSVYVTVEENVSELTAKEEEMIKERLRELGYLNGGE